MRVAVFRTLAIAAVFGAAACGEGPVKPEEVESVVLSPTATSVEEGASAWFTATVTGSRGTVFTDRQVSWSSSNEAVATVGSTGRATTNAPGSVTITATVDGRSGTAQLTVTPMPVGQVQVSPAVRALAPGDTVRMTAVVRSVNGILLADRPVSWASSAPNVAQVDAGGLVTGITPGMVTITATVEQTSGAGQVEVRLPSSVAVSGVSPSPIVEGAEATITGQGFSVIASQNVVRIGGVAATVLAATETSLRVRVPAGRCLPGGGINVQVISGGDQSENLVHPFRPAAFLDVPVGQQVILSDASAFCLQLDASSSNASYLIGVLSTSEIPGGMTTARVEARTGVAAPSQFSAPLPAMSAPPAHTHAAATPNRLADALPNRQAWKTEVREWEREFLPSRMHRALPAQRTDERMMAKMIPRNPTVGDTVPMRVPRSCANFTAIRTVVRGVGQRAVWLEDVENPAGGYTAADVKAFLDYYDESVYPTLTNYFGALTDIDNNGRVAIVATKEVNRTGAGGFVWSVDFFPSSTCAASNEGEVYYAMVPDPEGEFGSRFERQRVVDFGYVLIPHEVTHIIQFGRRLQSGSSTWASMWEMEGQATFSEEVMGHTMAGHSPRNNYGATIAYNNPRVTPISWYMGLFGALYAYYGFQSDGGKAMNAPEQCSWLGRPAQQAGTPCQNGNLPYGAPWMFLRWLSDHHGARLGGESAMHQALIENRFAGFRAIEDVIGLPIDTLLAQFTAMLYLDGRVSSLATPLTMPSWNLFNIEQSTIENARLTPRERGFTPFADVVHVRGGSVAYFRVSGGSRPGTAIRVTADDGAPLPPHMRVWVVRMQ
jgi:hypothetical protein